MFERMRQVVKFALLRIAPVFTSVWLQHRHEAHAQRIMTNAGVPAIASKLAAVYKRQVRKGPFEGLELLGVSVGSALLPKMIGSYEQELHDVFHAATEIQYDLIIDVGCAEGFYAVGLARNFPTITVRAFDTNPLAQKCCALLAKTNGLQDQVQVMGTCSSSLLAEQVAGQRCLIVSDCEGYESQLFTEDNVAVLMNSDVIIELHEGAMPGITVKLTELFRLTHELQVIPTQDRHIEDYSELREHLSPDEIRIALSEFRSGPQNWLVAISRKAAQRLKLPISKQAADSNTA